MEHTPHNTTEVLIVGAGPTGLMMACQLAIHRIPFRIIDKNSAPSQHSGALIVQARTLEILEQMGISSEAIKEGIVADEIDILFSGKRIAGTSIKAIGKNLSQFPFLLMLEQSKTEKLLLNFLKERGRYVERNVRFMRFTNDTNRITSEVMMTDGNMQTIVSNYLIGADGSKSAIREFLQIPFEGKTYPKPIYILDCKAASQIRSGAITFAFSGKSVAGFFPLPNQRWRGDGSFPDSIKKSENISLETVSEGFRHWNNLHFDVSECDWFSVSHSQQKYARTIRVGNCFLAGDSAHVNSPVGAQGMNTGLQDSHNLAWKLAFVLKGIAKPELLDSYSGERLGISKGFARYADVFFKLVARTNIAARLFRTIALKLFFKSIFPKLENNEKWRLQFFKAISQIDIRYKPTFGSTPDLERLFPLTAPKSGYRLPHVEFRLENKLTSTFQLLSTTGFTLFVMADEFTHEIKSLAEKHEFTTFLIKQEPGTDIIYKTLGITNTGYYLIRPDMYIAIRSATLDARALERYSSLLFKETAYETTELPVRI
ncbi:MAG TPA: FAD-dependent monooxygenase [Bacteroidales bacterium]|nr:FAD-dependent monooxygenase [Bacteroidales bacterium]